jgi:hypothetical protein
MGDGLSLPRLRTKEPHHHDDQPSCLKMLRPSPPCARPRRPTSVVIGGGLRIPPKGLLFFEKVVNAIHQGAPKAAIAFNTRPQDTAEAAARWIGAD